MTLKRTQTGAFGKNVVLDTRNITLLMPRLLGENAGGGMTIERGISTVRYLPTFFVSPKKH